MQPPPAPLCVHQHATGETGPSCRQRCVTPSKGKGKLGVLQAGLLACLECFRAPCMMLWVVGWCEGPVRSNPVQVHTAAHHLHCHGYRGFGRVHTLGWPGCYGQNGVGGTRPDCSLCVGASCSTQGESPAGTLLQRSVPMVGRGKLASRPLTPCKPTPPHHQHAVLWNSTGGPPWACIGVADHHEADPVPKAADGVAKSLLSAMTRTPSGAGAGCRGRCSCRVWQVDELPR